MSNEEKVSQKPLLYIVQPGIENVKATMQQYSVTKSEDTSSTKEAPTNTYDEPQSFEEDRQKKFRDMTIEEKVNYLTSLPSQMPKMKCEVLCESGRYRGYVQSYEDEMVHMKTFHSPYRAEVNITEIENIRLLGF
ncbi:CotO family spore coat protein [Salinibacillus xinjiangensis]|uniref:Spore coat protein CotO n=1 Tax=Salinibacillus xinjiangensis TaxID=1229268 RepID=A0A6G1X826_9BACI|nr:CotO family spore coat protein [Salinibacillus xinjiangensis]MRG87097.1 hypothetical protein [Salinibacillus xinjiangensis]